MQKMQKQLSFLVQKNTGSLHNFAYILDFKKEDTNKISIWQYNFLVLYDSV